jgi:hypothetical protein
LPFFPLSKNHFITTFVTDSENTTQFLASFEGL